MLGGHVGIEGDSGRIVNFVPKGKFHVFARNTRHSRYAVHSEPGFYAILGGNPDSVKKTVVYIPVTIQQRRQFDSLVSCYLERTPYDYAFFGMRCGAAAYDILGQLCVLPAYNSHVKTYKKIFYPKKLRKRLLKLALRQNWKVDRQHGSGRRKWESD